MNEEKIYQTFSPVHSGKRRENSLYYSHCIIPIFVAIVPSGVHNKCVNIWKIEWKIEKHCCFMMIYVDLKRYFNSCKEFRKEKIIE